MPLRGSCRCVRLLLADSDRTGSNAAGEYRRVADFVYRDVHYQLKVVMEKGKFENILKNLHFF